MNLPVVPRDAIRRLRAIMFTQPLQFPIGAGQHVNPPCAAYENRQMAILATASGRRFENLFGVVQERTHNTSLIVGDRKSLNRRFSRRFRNAVRKEVRGDAVAKTVSLIGIEASELKMIRMLINLLRHCDPNIPELANQALVYLTDTADKRTLGQNQTRDRAG